jgi:hypothetical protein
MTFGFAQFVSYCSSSFVELPFLFSTVFNEEAHIGKSKRIDVKEQIGAGDRMDNEEEVGPVSEWMTERGLGTSPNR